MIRMGERGQKLNIDTLVALLGNSKSSLVDESKSIAAEVLYEGSQDDNGFFTNSSNRSIHLLKDTND